MKNPGNYFKFKMTVCIQGGYIFSVDLRRKNKIHSTHEWQQSNSKGNLVNQELMC